MKYARTTPDLRFQGGSNARPIGPTATPHTNGPTATPQTGSLATDRSLSAMTGMSDTSDMLSMLDSVQLDTGAKSRSPRGSRGGSHRSSIDDREGRSSPFDNSVNSPIYFRKVDDLVICCFGLMTSDSHPSQLRAAPPCSPALDVGHARFFRSVFIARWLVLAIRCCAQLTSLDFGLIRVIRRSPTPRATIRATTQPPTPEATRSMPMLGTAR